MGPKGTIIGHKLQLSMCLFCSQRCISAVVGGSEYTRMEQEQRRNSLSNGHADELQEPELLSRASAEANIKSAMQIYVKLSAEIVLYSWNDTSRYCIFAPICRRLS
jgi:NCK-associated protein 1